MQLKSSSTEGRHNGRSNGTASSGLTNGTKPDPQGQPEYVRHSLEDAERLLKYAAEIGTKVEPGIRKSIFRARAAGSGQFGEKTTANLLTALTRLATSLKPVTAESLKESRNGISSTLRRYEIISIVLAIIVILFSAISFITTALSKSISEDIVTANGLAAKLRLQLGAAPPVDQRDLSKPPTGANSDEVIPQLQQYAATIRSIQARARQLNHFVFGIEMDPYAWTRTTTNSDLAHKTFQLEVGIPNLWDAAIKRTEVYQKVRSFAQSVLDDVSIFYGALIASVLPVLYALLGACAYLLRSFDQQMRTRTFIPSRAKSARFLIAVIGGAVVGLFNFTITQGASVPPLAIAFLVGYAVDVFFAFLEGLLQAFARKPAAA